MMMHYNHYSSWWSDNFEAKQLRNPTYMSLLTHSSTGSWSLAPPTPPGTSRSRLSPFRSKFLKLFGLWMPKQRQHPLPRPKRRVRQPPLGRRGTTWGCGKYRDLPPRPPHTAHLMIMMMMMMSCYRVSFADSARAQSERQRNASAKRVEETIEKNRT